MKIMKLTRYETARILGARALQISMGAPVLIKTKEKDSIKITLEEFKKGVIPLTILRE